MNELRSTLELACKALGIIIFSKIIYCYIRYGKQPSRYEMLVTIVLWL